MNSSPDPIPSPSALEIEEVKYLRSAITHKFDLILKIVAFVVTYNTVMMSGIFIESIKNELDQHKSDVTSVSLVFILLLLVACYSLVVRNIFSIRTIGGYLAEYHNSRQAGWEAASMRIGALYKAYDKIATDSLVRQHMPRPWFMLKSGTELTYGSFFCVIASAEILAHFAICRDFMTLDPKITISSIAAFINVTIVSFIYYITVGMLRRHKKWRTAWKALPAMNKGEQSGMVHRTASRRICAIVIRYVLREDRKGRLNRGASSSRIV